MPTRFFYGLLLILIKLSLSVAQAQVTAPSQGGAVAVTDVTATTMDLTFTGPGQGRMVAMAASAGSVPLIANDNTFYVGNASYGMGDPLGAGRVVYSGTAYTVTVTGLQPNTSYYITDAEYNANGASIAYNTNGTSISVSTVRASQVPLPVELTFFTGVVNAKGSAVLQWGTASERNSAYFALERSVDGRAFVEAGRVPAARTSSAPLAYQWADPQQLAQRTYYRLRQADQDGSVHYSILVVLTPSSRSARQVSAYPIPSAGQPIQLLLQGFASEKLNLRLVDILGHTVLSQHLAPSTAQTLVPLPTGLPAGTYILVLAGNGSNIQKRITVSY